MHLIYIYIYIYIYISKSDNSFRKLIMICQIIDSVDNHFGEYGGGGGGGRECGSLLTGTFRRLLYFGHNSFSIPML